jgi:hypothetical protein
MHLQKPGGISVYPDGAAAPPRFSPLRGETGFPQQPVGIPHPAFGGLRIKSRLPWAEKKEI